MRVAQIAPLYESVPPTQYGGTERVVHYLTEELVHRGHDVTLFASGDSVTSARLVAPCPTSLRSIARDLDALPEHVTMIEKVADARDAFDVLHFHVDFLHFPLFRRLGVPWLTTLHGRLDRPGHQCVFDVFDDVPVVSISRAQRRPLPKLAWVGNVPHGLPLDLLPFEPNPDGYFAFLGRLSPEKRVDRAIQIATRLGVPLKVAAKVDAADRAYFETEIRELLDHPLVEFVGEIGEREKAEFLGKARALLFPIDWPEPFGLVMIEAMACGTPVVAYRAGSVPEVLEHGVTGFVVDGLDAAIEAARRVDTLDRARIRARFEQRFSARRMAADYERIYERLVGMMDGTKPSPRLHPTELGGEA